MICNTKPIAIYICIGSISHIHCKILEVIKSSTHISQALSLSLFSQDDKVVGFFFLFFFYLCLLWPSFMSYQAQKVKRESFVANNNQLFQSKIHHIFSEVLVLGAVFCLLSTVWTDLKGCHQLTQNLCSSINSKSLLANNATSKQLRKPHYGKW